MNQREENQYSSQQWISQEQPEPKPWMQIVAVVAFVGFIILTPTIIDRLGK